MDHWRTRALALMNNIEDKVGANDWGMRENITSILALALRSLDEMMYPATQDAINMHIIEIVDRLQFRLKIINEINQNPKVHSIPIKSPVFIIGNPRTGSTLLHNLLGMDPLTRCPRLFEMRHPSSDVSKEQRIAEAASWVQGWNDRCRRFSQVHPMDPMAPDECAQILGCDLFLVLMILSSSFRKAFYSLPHDRIVDMYKFHKQTMQLFESQTPMPGHEHWTFKSPTHIVFLKMIREVYPDAKFIWIHRNPVDVISSYATYWESHCGWMFGPEAKKDKESRTKAHLAAYSNSLNQATKLFAELESTENSPIVAHCHYSDLKRDPIGTIRNLYADLGRNFSSEFEASLRSRFQDMEKSHQKAPYSTSLEGTGLTQDDILNAYSYYLNTCPAFQLEHS